MNAHTQLFEIKLFMHILLYIEFLDKNLSAFSLHAFATVYKWTQVHKACPLCQVLRAAFATRPAAKDDKMEHQLAIVKATANRTCVSVLQVFMIQMDA